MSVVPLRKKIKTDFDLEDVLSSAAIPSETKTGKSKVPVLTVSKELQEKVARIRAVKTELDSLESEYETISAELIEGISPLRVSLCIKQGYASAVRVPDGKGLSIGVSWSDKYSKIPAENEKTLRTIAGDRFDEYFKSDIVITVSDISEESLTEIVKAIGPDRFKKFFAVEKTFKPTTRFTHEMFTAFTEEERQKFSQAGVKQNKPSIRAK